MKLVVLAFCVVSLYLGQNTHSRMAVYCSAMLWLYCKAPMKSEFVMSLSTKMQINFLLNVLAFPRVVITIVINSKSNSYNNSYSYQ